MRTDDTPLTQEEQINQDNLTAKVCARALPITPTVPERYRGHIVQGFNDIPRYLNEQAAQGYKFLSLTCEDGYLYVLVERERHATWRTPEFEAAERPAHWE